MKIGNILPLERTVFGTIVEKRPVQVYNPSEGRWTDKKTLYVLKTKEGKFAYMAQEGHQSNLRKGNTVEASVTDNTILTLDFTHSWKVHDAQTGAEVFYFNRPERTPYLELTSASQVNPTTYTKAA